MFKNLRQTLLERRRRPLWIMTLAWVVPISWVAALPPPGEEWRGLPRTHGALKRLSALVKSYEAAFKGPPSSLSELRAYGRTKDMPCPTFDGYGQQFEFLRLGRSEYALRSFGADGRQNTLDSEPDPTLVSWRNPLSEGMHYAYEAAILPTTFAAPLLAGAASPTGSWTAEVTVDPQGTRQLLVRRRTTPHLFMLAPHDHVEEFLWMPNGFQIVFTASGSRRYRDGVYLWNLMDDSNLAIFDGTEATTALPMLSERAAGLVLALAGISEAGPTVLFYAMADRGPVSINPVDFHALKNLRAVRISQVTGSQPTVDHVPTGANPDWSALGGGPPRHGLWTDKGETKPVQDEWLALPYKGPIEGVISTWQTYAAKYSSSPLLPYALWTIAALYGDAWADLAQKSARDAEVLRAFGAEIAARLEALPTAPRYLRYESRFVRERLAEGKGIPFRLAEYTGLP